jgi:hypothetical protein
MIVPEKCSEEPEMKFDTSEEIPPIIQRTFGDERAWKSY